MLPYAVSKLVGEKFCKVFTKLYGLETVSLRYTSIVFGPRMDQKSAYAALSRSSRTGYSTASR